MSHAPKTAALIAYDAGALSAAGKARLERHLAGCSVCRDELAKAKLWTRESARIRAISERPPVDFAKMELAIAREAQTEARRNRAERSPGIAIPAVAVAAMVLLSVGLSRVAGPIVRPSGPPSPTPVAALEPGIAFEPRVTLAAGDARIVRDTIARRASAGERVEIGESVVAAGGELHLRLADGTGLATVGEGGFSLEPAPSSDGLVVRHDGGRLVAEVTLPEHGSSVFVVLAAAYRIEARVARFVVDLDPAEGTMTLALETGRVEVHEGDTHTVLEAPATWPEGASLEGSMRVVGVEEGASDWPTLTASAPEIVRWELGGTPFVGGPELSTLAPIGEHDLIGYDASGGAFRFHAILGADGLRVEGDDLVPDAPRARDGYLSSAVLMGVVRESAGRLEHCYQQALRLRALSGDIRARVRLSARGSVMSVRILGEDAPPSLERCVTTEAERWVFPPPGGPMSFDLPLSFRSR